MQAKLAIIISVLGWYCCCYCSAPYQNHFWKLLHAHFFKVPTKSSFSNDLLSVCIFRVGDMGESIYKLVTAKALICDQDWKRWLWAAKALIVKTFCNVEAWVTVKPHHRLFPITVENGTKLRFCEMQWQQETRCPSWASMQPRLLATAMPINPMMKWPLIWKEIWPLKPPWSF